MIYIIITALVLPLVVALLVFIFQKDNNTENTPHHFNKHYNSTPDKENIADSFLCNLINNNGYLLTNVLLPLNNEENTEIDAIIISNKGIFCIEVKNWIGKISGDNYDKYWIQHYYDPSKEDKKHRNPYLQNQNHCYALAEFLNNAYSIINIVLFVELDEFSEIYSSSTFSLDNFALYYNSLASDIITNDDIDYVYDTLKVFEATKIELENHRNFLKNKYRD